MLRGSRTIQPEGQIKYLEDLAISGLVRSLITGYEPQMNLKIRFVILQAIQSKRDV